MQALKCELCGSNEIIKNDGLFVCQHCGTKYSPAEAKKIMVEGTIKINNIDSINNCLELAEHAVLSHNFKEAELYCNKVLEMQSTIPKAWLIKGIATGWQTDLSNIRIREALLCFDKAIEYSSDNLRVQTKETARKQMNNFMEAILEALSKAYINNPSKDIASTFIKTAELLNILYKQMAEIHGVEIENISQKIEKTVIVSVDKAYDTTMLYDYNEHGKKHPNKADYDRFRYRIYYARVLLDTVFSFCDDKDLKESNLKTKFKIVNYEYGIQSHTIRNGEWVVEYSLTDERKQEIRNEAWELVAQIKKYDPSFEPPKGGGCYIATAIYGSYDCPQVWILRRFRDRYLLKSNFGTLFVKVYYFISPKLVKKFGKSHWFNRICSLPINYLVRTLRANGVSGAPYSDR